jgi:hypothetical protein
VRENVFDHGLKYLRCAVFDMPASPLQKDEYSVLGLRIRRRLLLRVRSKRGKKDRLQNAIFMPPRRPRTIDSSGTWEGRLASAMFFYAPIVSRQDIGADKSHRTCSRRSEVRARNRQNTSQVRRLEHSR